MWPLVCTSSAEKGCDPTDSKSLFMDPQKDKISEYINKASENILFSSENSNNSDHDCSSSFTRSASPEPSMFHLLPSHDLQHKLSHLNHYLNLGDSNENSFDLTEKIFKTLNLSSTDEIKAKDCSKHLEDALKSVYEISNFEHLGDHCRSHYPKVPIPIPFIKDDKDKALYNNCLLLSQNDTKLSATSIDLIDDNNILNRLSSKSIAAKDKFSPEITKENFIFLHLNSMNVTMSTLPTGQGVYASSSHCWDGLIDSSFKFRVDDFLASKNHEICLPYDSISPKISICNNDLEHSKKILEEINLVADYKMSKIAYETLEKRRFLGMPQVCDSLGFEHVFKDASKFLARCKCIKGKLNCSVELHEIDCNFKQMGVHNHAGCIDNNKYAILNKVNENSPAVLSHPILNSGEFYEKSNLQPFGIQLQCKLSESMSTKKILFTNTPVDLTGHFLETLNLKSDGKVNFSNCSNNSHFGDSSLMVCDHAVATQDPNNTFAFRESGLYVENLVTKIKYVSLKNGTIYGNPKVYDSLGYKYTLGTFRKRNIDLVWLCCSANKRKCRVTLQQSENNFEQNGRHRHTENLDQFNKAIRSKSMENSPRIFPLSIRRKTKRKVIHNKQSSISNKLRSQNKHLICEEISSMEPLNLPVEESYIPNDILASKPKEERSIASKQHSNSVHNYSNIGNEYSSVELLHSVVPKKLSPRSITHVNSMEEHIIGQQVNLCIPTDTILPRNQARKSFEQVCPKLKSVVKPADKYLFIQNNISKIKYISLRKGIVAPFKSPKVIDSLGFIYKTSIHQCSNKKMEKWPPAIWYCIRARGENDKCPAMLKQTTHNFDQKGVHNHYGNADYYYSKALKKKIVENSPVIFSRSYILTNFCRKSRVSPLKRKMRMSAVSLNLSNVKTLNERNSDFNKNKGTRKSVRENPSFLKSGTTKKKSVGWKVFPHYAVLKGQGGDIKLVDRVQGFVYNLLKTTEKFKTWICSRTNTHCCKAAIKQCGPHFFKMRHKHVHKVNKRESSTLNNKISIKFKEKPQLQSYKTSPKVKPLTISAMVAKIKEDENFLANKAIIEVPHQILQKIQITDKFPKEIHEGKNFNSLEVNSAVMPNINMPAKRNVKIEKMPEINARSRITKKLNAQINKNLYSQYIENINEAQSLQNRKRLRQPKSYYSLKANETNALGKNAIKEKLISNSKVLSIDTSSSIAYTADSDTKKVNYVGNKCDDDIISDKRKQLLLATNSSESEESALSDATAVSEFSRKSSRCPLVCEKKLNFSFYQEKLLEKVIKDILNIGYPLRSRGFGTAKLFKLLKEGCQYFRDKEMTINIWNVPSALWVEEFICKNSLLSQQYQDLVIMSYSAYSWTKLHWFYGSFEKSLKQNYKLDPCDYLDIKNSPRVFACDLIKIAVNESCKETALKNVFNVLCCVNSFGQYINPLIIDNNHAIRKTAKMEEVNNYFMVGSNNGKLNHQIFHDWLLKFDSTLVKREVPRPVILFLNGKNSCISYNSVKHAENRNIVLYFLPPNSSHILNPLYISVFPKLKANFIKIAHKIVKAKKFPFFFMKAYKDLNLFELAQKGFQEARLCPYSGNIFDRSMLKNGYSSKADCGKIELVLPHNSRSNKDNNCPYSTTVSDAINANMSPIKHVSWKNAEIEAKDEITSSKYKFLDKSYLPSAKIMTSIKNLLLDKHGVILEEEYLESEEIYPNVPKNYTLEGTKDFNTFRGDKTLSFSKEENLLEYIANNNRNLNSTNTYCQMENLPSACCETQTLCSTSKIDDQRHSYAVFSKYDEHIEDTREDSSVIKSNLASPFNFYLKREGLCNSAVSYASKRHVKENTCTLTSMDCTLNFDSSQSFDMENFLVTASSPDFKRLQPINISSLNKDYNLRPKESSPFLRGTSQNSRKTNVRNKIENTDNLIVKDSLVKLVSKVSDVTLVNSANACTEEIYPRPLKRKRLLGNQRESSENMKSNYAK